MSRLVIAVLILIAVLLGLRIISSPFFQQNILNRIGGSNQTQTTGFNTTVPADLTSSTSSQPSTQPLNPQPNSGGTTGGGTTSNGETTGNSGTTNNGNTTRNGTSAQSQPLRPIPGGW
jgi:hypothetical protein